jgi:hypothetical protein
MNHRGQQGRASGFSVDARAGGIVLIDSILRAKAATAGKSLDGRSGQNSENSNSRNQ